MLEEKVLKKLEVSKSEEVCKFVSLHLEKLSDEDLEIIENILIKKQDAASLAWYMDNVRVNEKLEKALEEAIYKIPLKVETLSDEEFENLKDAVEEYEECSQNKKQNTNSRR